VKFRELFRRPFDLKAFAFLLPVALLAIAYAMTPVRSGAYWWHLTVGRLIDYWARVPETNHFAYTAPAELSLGFEPWASQWFLFVVHDVGGIELPMFLRNVFVAVSLMIVMVVGLRRSSQVARTAIVGSGAAALLYFAVEPAPVMFVVLPWAVLIAVAFFVHDRGRHCWLLLLFPLVAGLWANLATAFVAPTLLAKGFALATARDDRRGALAWFAAGLATIPAWLFTPYGAGIFAEVLRLDVATVVACAALVLPPLLATRIPKDFDHLLARSPGPLWSVVLTSLLVLAAFAVQPIYPGQEQLPVVASPYTVRPIAPLAGRVGQETPVECVERLYGTGKQLRILHPPEQAGFLLYRLQDPRRPDPVVTNLPAAAGVVHPSANLYELTRDREVARGLIQQHQINAVIVEPTTHGPLVALLEADPSWYVLAERDDQICFLRR
jgi:hypothetical protein